MAGCNLKAKDFSSLTSGQRQVVLVWCHKHDWGQKAFFTDPDFRIGGIDWKLQEAEQEPRTMAELRSWAGY